MSIALPTLAVIDLIENLTFWGHLELRALFAASFDCVVLNPKSFQCPHPQDQSTEFLALSVCLFQMGAR
uniref:hypothetical protein n=1 Tax=Thiolapillus sp. TaxID=2017437 RepID=UPI003AF4E1FC